jgi:hypothetical protein
MCAESNVCGVFGLPPPPNSSATVSSSSTQSLLSFFVCYDNTEIVNCYYDLALALPYFVCLSRKCQDIVFLVRLSWNARYFNCNSLVDETWKFICTCGENRVFYTYLVRSEISFPVLISQ